jgi:hypothetical protein
LALSTLSLLSILADPLRIRGLTEAASEIEKRQQTSVSNKQEIERLRRANAEANGVPVRDQDILLPRDAGVVGDTVGTLASYPSDLSKFYMRMDFKKYERPSPNVPGITKTEYSVAFPLPTNLEEKHDIDYEPYDADIVGAVVNSFNEGQGITVSAAIRPLASFIRNTVPQGQSIINVASQKLAAALNPNKSIVFNSVKFRSYSFSWNFAPNSEQESETLRKIIRKIKSYSLPTYAKISENGNNVDYNLFNYPYMVKVKLYPWASPQIVNSVDREMFQTKHCVIDSISINYSPENNLSFFNSERNSPTFVSLTLNLTEIELFTGEDFGREGDFINLQDLANGIKNERSSEDSNNEAAQATIDEFTPPTG